jgi:hypothetical protein
MSSTYRGLVLRLLGAAATLLLVVGISASRAQAQLVTFLDTVFTGGSEQEPLKQGVIDSITPNFMGPGRGLENDGNNDGFSSPPSHFDVEVPMPVGGTASKFFATVECKCGPLVGAPVGLKPIIVECLSSGDIGAGADFRFDVLKNGALTGITCKAFGPVSTAEPHSVSCSDVAHKVVFSEGDNLSIRVEGEPQPADGPLSFEILPPVNDDCRVSGWSLDYNATPLSFD